MSRIVEPIAKAPRPIIVLGAARSGTKFLRDTLAASAEVAVVPYDVNFVWRTGNESCPHDALTPEMCSDEAARAIRAGLFRAAGMGARDSRRLIEKTVSNTLRLEFVAQVFPNADFVHIVRDGRDVVESAIRQWQAPINWQYLLDKARTFPLRNYRYALWYLLDRAQGKRHNRGGSPVWGVRYAGIEADLSTRSVAEICAHQWVASVRSVREAARRRPDIRLRELRYGDLVSSDAAVRGVVDWLELAERDAIVARYRETLRRDGLRRWNATMSPQDAAAVLRIIQPLQREIGHN